MALQRCPECKREVSSRALNCPHCGRILKRLPPADGSAGLCPVCFNKMNRSNRSKSLGVGCIVVLIGLFLAPIIIGIPVFIYGIVMMFRQEYFWICPKCQTKYPINS
jgi:hypothetical protein